VREEGNIKNQVCEHTKNIGILVSYIPLSMCFKKATQTSSFFFFKQRTSISLINLSLCFNLNTLAY